MLRKAASAASGLLTGPASQRAFSVPARAVVTADADKGLWAAMFGSTPKAMPPLTQPLLGVEYPAEPNYPATPPATKVTTLKNGVRIATEDTPVRPRSLVPNPVLQDSAASDVAPGRAATNDIQSRCCSRAMLPVVWRLGSDRPGKTPKPQDTRRGVQRSGALLIEGSCVD